MSQLSMSVTPEKFEKLLRQNLAAIFCTDWILLTFFEVAMLI